MIYSGHIVDVLNRRIFNGEIEVADGKIVDIREVLITDDNAPYYLPGFIDSHFHIESTMMTPTEVAYFAAKSGTIGMICTPSGIANVLGIPGIDYLIRMAEKVNFNFWFGAPSCVPCIGTKYESGGAVLSTEDVINLLKRDDIHFLGEMLNYKGVIDRKKEELAKIEAAKKLGKPIDGQAPALSEKDRKAYVNAGISTEHECNDEASGRSCLEAGMYLQIREGSASKNFNSLIPLLKEFPDKIMFCTDHRNSAGVRKGDINLIVARALKAGYDLMDVLTAACITPQLHYHTNWGMLRVGDPATFISIDRIDEDFTVLETLINGAPVDKVDSINEGEWPNKFAAEPITEADLEFNSDSKKYLDVITAYDENLVTGHSKISVNDTGYPWEEVQKIVVLNRYHSYSKPVVGLIRGFNMYNGAMATSLSYDANNIVAIGSSDENIVRAINRIIELKGGVVAICEDDMEDLSLPLAGLISPLDGETLASKCIKIHKVISHAGCTLRSPVMTLAFMCLPTIPSLKITDKGLINLG